MDADARIQFDEKGFYLARGLFTQEEVAEVRNHFMEMRTQGPKPGDHGGDPAKGNVDPLNKFPRFINMHDWDEKSKVWQRDPRLMDNAAKLVGDEVELCQTMLYFKPPGARGQGLHQDNQYIRRYPIIAGLRRGDGDRDAGRRCRRRGGKSWLAGPPHSERAAGLAAPATPGLSPARRSCASWRSPSDRHARHRGTDHGCAAGGI